VTPSLLYLPRVDCWWNVTSETFQVTLISSLSSLPPSTPLFILATTECMWEELPDKLRALFGNTDTHSYMVLPPDLNQRNQLFYDVLLEKPLQPPPHTPRFLSGEKHEDEEECARINLPKAANNKAFINPSIYR